jgi:hypothetical protein
VAVSAVERALIGAMDDALNLVMVVTIALPEHVHEPIEV